MRSFCQMQTKFLTRRIQSYFCICSSLLLLTIPAGPAAAQDNNPGQAIGGIFRAIIGAALISSARENWSKIDPEIQECLARRHNISIPELINSGIGPRDQRVAPYIENCKQLIAQEQLERQQREAARLDEDRAREQARQDEAEAERRQARADAVATVRAAREKRLADAAAQAERVASRRKLTAEYGDAFATAILAHEVRKGMTKAAVTAAQGQPNRVEAIPPNDELWVYPGNRVVFTSGKVSYVGH